MPTLRRIDDVVAWLEDTVLAIGVALLACLLFANVLLRYVFRNPFAWLEEGVVALFVWLVFIGASAAFRSHQHLRIDVLVRYLPPRAEAVVGCFAIIISFVILFLLIAVGIDYARFVAGNRTPVLGISAAWLYGGLPFGMTLAMIHLVRQSIDEGPADVLRSVIEGGDGASGQRAR